MLQLSNNITRKTILKVCIRRYSHPTLRAPFRPTGIKAIIMLNLEFSIMAVGPSEKLFKGSFHFSIYKLLIPVRVPSWPLWSWFEYILILKPDIRNIISILDNTVYVVLSAVHLILLFINNLFYQREVVLRWKIFERFPPAKTVVPSMANFIQVFLDILF